MQIHFSDVSSGECPLRQVREEEFVDNTRTGHANRTLLEAFWMGRYHHATRHALGANRHFWTVVEAAHDLAFRALLGLIGRQVQPRLHERMIEDGVVFAAGHESEASEIGEDGPRAILTIEPEQRVCWWKLVRGEIATNGRQALTQFLSVATVAAIAKRAEPVETVGLADDRAGTHHLPPLAPGVERRHTRHPTSQKAGAGLRPGARRVDGRPHGCHQDQRRSTHRLFDRPGSRFASRW